MTSLDRLKGAINGLPGKDNIKTVVSKVNKVDKNLDKLADLIMDLSQETSTLQMAISSKMPIKSQLKAMIDRADEIDGKVDDIKKIKMKVGATLVTALQRLQIFAHTLSTLGAVSTPNQKRATKLRKKLNDTETKVRSKVK